MTPLNFVLHRATPATSLQGYLKILNNLLPILGRYLSSKALLHRGKRLLPFLKHTQITKCPILALFSFTAFVYPLFHKWRDKVTAMLCQPAQLSFPMYSCGTLLTKRIKTPPMNHIKAQMTFSKSQKLTLTLTPTQLVRQWEIITQL